ncbi:MAG: bifunctional UDP-N-acetylglucosamine diphosphorylase/glucosamine-1-phosphate N-acetyltransferase GlmU [Acidobacteriaceae bacterium]|nr:bifunctional UDP-N-acetylglucosamine diphosphorylase/glucosamine-1-phosphate N-acetyltransferase GlmU [Acidobacteriaceae bacterium]
MKEQLTAATKPQITAVVQPQITAAVQPQITANQIVAVILGAGLGTRMKSAKAKVLHEAGGDTLLNHVIRAALSVTQRERIVVVVGHQADTVKASVRVPGVRFALQPEQKGTGHAARCAQSAVDSEDGLLLILNGDGPLLRAETIQELVKAATSNGGGGALVTTYLPDPTGYGRIVRDQKGMIASIVEQKSGTPEQLAIREVNPGAYCFSARAFWKHVGELQPSVPANELYLTDMAEILARHGHPVAPLPIEDHTELLGINTRVELAIADRILRTRKTTALMLSGVTIEYPETVTIDANVEVAPDSVIEAGVQLRGNTTVGANCRIGTGSVLRNCRVADEVTILPYVIANDSSIGARSFVGPFSRLRMEAEAGECTHIGNFVELKKTNLGAGSKASHLAYLGDASIGKDVNVGAGTITCNYDGERKHPTKIDDGAFVGSNSTLVAPLTVGKGAYVGAGSTITKDVAPDALALGRAFQVEKPEWARKRRAAKTGSKNRS